MANWDWTMIGGIAAVVGVAIAVIALFKRSSAPSQTSGDRGVNIAGSNSGDINTGSQTKKE